MTTKFILRTQNLRSSSLNQETTKHNGNDFLRISRTKIDFQIKKLHCRSKRTQSSRTEIFSEAGKWKVMRHLTVQDLTISLRCSWEIAWWLYATVITLSYWNCRIFQTQEPSRIGKSVSLSSNLIPLAEKRGIPESTFLDWKGVGLSKYPACTAMPWSASENPTRMPQIFASPASGQGNHIFWKIRNQRAVASLFQ